MIKQWEFFVLLTLSILSSNGTGATAAEPEFEVRYVSSDLDNVAVFSADSARIGPDLAAYEVWPSSPARYFETMNHVQCVSIGGSRGTIEYAIKRPIKPGDQYKCLKTSFRVIRCFGGCRAAVVERIYPLGGYAKRGTVKTYLYVDSCSGVLAFSQKTSLTEGIPLDAPWLRGKVGILADKGNPGCANGGS
ncbi:MAG TPA: hypothetical protein VF535_15085 [Allosphingosinicella sp.]